MNLELFLLFIFLGFFALFLSFFGIFFSYKIGKKSKCNEIKVGWLSMLCKEFLHDSRNHISIIDGFACLLNRFDCPIMMCDKDKYLEIIIQHNKSLSKLIKKIIMLIMDYDLNHDSSVDIRLFLNDLRQKNMETIEV